MTEKLKQIIKEEVGKLPQEAREAINSFDWTKTAEEIGKKFLLSDSDLNDFQTETLLILTGLEYGADYARNIENNVGMSKEDANKIVEEANLKIFTPISIALEENVKKNLKNKNPGPQQNLSFILSGGDYFTFLEKENEDTKKT